MVKLIVKVMVNLTFKVMVKWTVKSTVKAGMIESVSKFLLNETISNGA